MKTSNVILGIAAGMAAGAIIGVLMAPSSGDDTRKKIVSKTQDAVVDLKNRFNSLVDGFVDHKEEMLQVAKNKVTDMTNKVSDKVTDKVADVSRKFNT